MSQVLHYVENTTTLSFYPSSPLPAKSYSFPILNSNFPLSNLHKNSSSSQILFPLRKLANLIFSRRVLTKLRVLIGCFADCFAEVIEQIHKAGDFVNVDVTDRKIQKKVKFQGMVDVMLQNGEEDTIDSGPLFIAFGVNKRGRTRCVSSVISRRAILASSFALHLFQEMDEQRQDINAAMATLHEDNEKLKQQMNELAEGLRSGAFTAHRTNQSSSHIPYVGGNSRADSSRPSPNTIPEEIPCAILSLSGKIIGYGRKNPLGSVERVHGHTLKSSEARVVLDAIHDHTHELWGGEQYGHRLLGDLSIGSFLYWLDELLPPLDID